MPHSSSDGRRDRGKDAGMFVFIGLIMLFVCVFGVFYLHGGSMDVLILALPAELATILGAGLAAMIVGNDPGTLKHVLVCMRKVFGGERWQKQDFLDVIVLVSGLFRTLGTKGAKWVESDIEDPFSSPLFRKYPNLLADKPLVAMICDSIRLVVASTGSLNAHAVEELLDVRIKSFQSHDKHAVHALTSLAGALPALGIVACVLGIVKTMASIDQPPAILGVLIGSALLGTFLGVFLAYGIVEPIAKRLSQISDVDAQIYHVVKQIFVATLRGHPQPLVIEAARVSVGGTKQPTFDDVFEYLMDRSRDGNGRDGQEKP